MIIQVVRGTAVDRFQVEAAQLELTQHGECRLILSFGEDSRMSELSIVFHSSFSHNEFKKKMTLEVGR